MTLYIISVGGSLIVPKKIDTYFLSSFKIFIINRIQKGDRFIIITGGGKTARNYQNAAAEISEIDNEEKDWIGIHSTRLNAHLLRTIFKKYANPKIFKNFDRDDIDFKEKILIGAGWKPGWSTDYIATLLAKKYGSKIIINLSNIDYIYSDDPKINLKAKKIEDISWVDFRELVGSQWDPGMSVPFDPIASKLAQKEKFKVIILNGKNISNIIDYMDGRKFIGSIIS